MKIFNSIPFIAIAILLIVNSGCIKERPTQNQGNNIQLPPPPPPPPRAFNTAPNCNAGQDILLFLPTNSCPLYGGAYDRENNIQTFLWSKISGSSSFLIEHPDSLRTKVGNLEIGIYYFELTVTDSGGLSNKDIIKVTVAPVINNNNGVIFENLVWGSEGLTTTLLWGSAIIIHNISQYLPTAGTPFTTFIKRDNSTNWEELIPGNYISWYTFDIVNNTLIIWSSYEETDTPDIKLVY